MCARHLAKAGHRSCVAVVVVQFDAIMTVVTSTRTSVLLGAGLPCDEAALRQLVSRWREDPGGTYQTWFLWPERLKNFRSLRRGIEQVSAEIEAGTFGTAYRGSSLETVVHGIAEQRQMFKGADHPFLWKPKLRIPDIYENRDNQLVFGRMLETCRCCTSEAQVLAAVRTLRNGTGPAQPGTATFSGTIPLGGMVPQGEKREPTTRSR